ncbi:DUF4041 domain-containing protein [Rhodococcus sp. 06-418-5]|uniref:DUF4041 domain-containing protein n=2 Tax=Mycobacteriales TaxID=85007 RepID=UPI000564D851|nr:MULTISPECIES: DUF4041 domain-containing protein [Rhodococcus]OZC67140.1 DUF4041 domain-containing protein [Rhodococcus sp. 06-470-2]OZC76949.1 DUF4041 domain-containing protein [Rhodococcus sp. 06-418-5]OZE58812.1 DUF4041 domain-containing protein [Rhodococcus sp. 05-2221-1B]QII07261.1 DUF4041 domain-containing protein [Rhodococcus fascians A25f]
MTGPDDTIRALRTTLVAKERELNDLLDRLKVVEQERDEARLHAARWGSSPEPASGPAPTGVVETDDRIVLQEVGIYTYQHPLENAEQFRERLATVRDEIKAAVVGGGAIVASDMFSFNNSLVKGRKMTSDLSKLMLRAYNAEADICVRTIRAGNLATAVNRLEKAAATIAKLGDMMQMHVAETYHRLRVEELELTADYMMKVQEEKLAQREERERLREERKVEQELAAQREKLDKERAHYQNVLDSLAGRTDAESQRIRDKLGELDQAIAQNDYRRANIRAGYVYVISNRGAFGPDVVKIGMTRRLEPMDRVRELGSASVPFPFDVHALYFSDDAVALEGALHAAFTTRRLNHANLRREFFFAEPGQVREVLAQKVGNLLEYTEEPEATQYFQSRGSWPTSVLSRPEV